MRFSPNDEPAYAIPQFKMIILRFARSHLSLKADAALWARRECFEGSFPYSLSSHFHSQSPSRRPFTFKSDSHRHLTIMMTRSTLQNSLLERFGIVGQMECRILGKPNFLPVLTEWASYLVNQSPENPKVDPFMIPQKILSQHYIKRCMDSPEVKWLVERIQQDKSLDCIPRPHFPSVLKLEMPRWPFNPYELEQMQAQYGLLKWPFRDPSTLHKTKTQQSLDERAISSIKPSEKADSRSDDDHSEHDAAFIRPWNQPNAPVECQSSFIYAPSDHYDLKKDVSQDPLPD
ncbi:hypothetical protein IE077_003388 [Cardiosporidium cionae]|uniref:Uncharacterized protein n=1 Tax=Cardiosporidium cionae TaxID=476202 RepID=A0ABQ7JF02_9APIC|nr:hypothetical protein IE077_003388 [Cardiosporidium cionae]|eukprot:KAF8822591.1 hypothetical protein IE077_003388 [Cardiosporidium cionae]